MIAAMTETSAPSRTRKAARPQKSTPAKRVKASLLISAEVDIKLTIYAKMHGLDKSEAANQILGEKVKSIFFGTRSASVDPSPDTLEDRQDGPTS